MESKKQKHFQKMNFYISLVMLATAAIVQEETWQITQPDSRMLPQLVALLMFVCGGVLLVATIFSRDGRNSRQLLLSGRQLLAVLFLALFCFLAGRLGFYVSLFFLVIGEGALMLDLRQVKLRQVVMLLAGSLVLTLVLSQAFIHVFHLVTPRGLLF